jgi:hypothetical protein
MVRLLVVTNASTGIGGETESDGILIVSNASFLAADVFVSGQESGAELAIDNGTVTLSGELGIGFGDKSLGDVFLNGGALTVTNGTTTVTGQITVSGGLFLARDFFVGTIAFSGGMLSVQGGISILSSNLQIGGAVSKGIVSLTGGQLFVTNAPIVITGSFPIAIAECIVSSGELAARIIELNGFSGGTLIVDGGSVTVSAGITLGDCASGTIGYVSVDDGQLIVTNAVGTGFIDVRSEELTLDGGTLRVDKLVMTNTCGSFIHTGGTLVAGSVILDPNAFRITSVAREGNNLRVTWLMAPGQTNALQVSSGGIHGSYATNGFTDIFVVTNNTTPGTLTNYLDMGAATNVQSRFYRARLAP